MKSLGPVASHDSLREETAVKREQKLSPMLISPQMLRNADADADADIFTCAMRM